MKIRPKIISLVLLSGAAVLGTYAGVKAHSIVSKDVDQGILYLSLKEKVDQISDKNLDGRIGLDEAKSVLSQSYANEVDVEKILMGVGYCPNIREMQNYLRSERRFDEKTDDLKSIGEQRKEFRFAARGVTL